MAKSNRIDWNTESENLRRSIGDDDQIEILDQTDESISLLDFTSGRELKYRLIPHTEDSLHEILYAGTSTNLTEEQTTGIIAKLLRLPPETLLSVKKIALVASFADMEQLLQLLDIDDDDMPSQLVDEDDNENLVLTDNLVGLHWHYESIVIVNLYAIRKIAAELAGDETWRLGIEEKHGFWVTLLHELRHNQIDAMLYTVPWISDGDGTEESVEEWARRTYETLIHD